MVQFHETFILGARLKEEPGHGCFHAREVLIKGDLSWLFLVGSLTISTHISLTKVSHIMKPTISSSRSITLSQKGYTIK